ncbi:MAG TPA: CPXCG motif-containing cysteine-rich protein [Gemmatimonadaceae bacterium]|nr:CPXCG motif-containing cysteine-rich protein [Gemmatimonadaceae bacterium]
MRIPADDDSDSLDEEFPLGDGAADTEATVICPYCAEEVEITLDPGGGADQQYVEDCEVCSQPWRVSVTYLEDGQAEVTVEALDE